MTVENWVGVGVIISTMIGPIGATILESRLRRPERQPDANQPPKRRPKRAGWVSRLFTSPPLFILVALLNAYQRVVLLRGTGPVTRSTVFGIAVSVAGILLNLGTSAMLALMRAIQRTVDVYGESIISLYGHSERMLGLIEKAGDLREVARAKAEPSA